MGRHGKNLGAPLAKQRQVAPEWFNKSLHAWEKELITDQERTKIAEEYFHQGLNTCYAIMLNILVWHYDDEKLKNMSTRLARLQELSDEGWAELELPTMKQEFSEWYYEQQTGRKLKRLSDEKGVSINMKPYAKELAAILQDEAKKQGKTLEGIRQKLSMTKSIFNNIIYNGQPKKEAFMAIVNELGLELTQVQQNMVKECFQDRRNKSQHFADIKDALEKEPEAPAKILVEEPKAEEPAIDTPEPIEVPTEAEAVVEEPAGEELPFADCNEMYREAPTFGPEQSFLTFARQELAERQEEQQADFAYINSLEERIANIKKGMEKRSNIINAVQLAINTYEDAING